MRGGGGVSPLEEKIRNEPTKTLRIEGLETAGRKWKYEW